MRSTVSLRVSSFESKFCFGAFILFNDASDMYMNCACSCSAEFDAQSSGLCCTSMLSKSVQMIDARCAWSTLGLHPVVILFQK